MHPTVQLFFLTARELPTTFPPPHRGMAQNLSFPELLSLPCLACDTSSVFLLFPGRGASPPFFFAREEVVSLGLESFSPPPGSSLSGILFCAAPLSSHFGHPFPPLSPLCEIISALIHPHGILLFFLPTEFRLGGQSRTGVLLSLTRRPMLKVKRQSPCLLLTARPDCWTIYAWVAFSSAFDWQAASISFFSFPRMSIFVEFL